MNTPNRDVDFKALTVIKTGALPKNGEQFALVSLSPANIGPILALQDAIFETLTEEEQSFVVKKGHDFFTNHFANGNIVLGVVHNGKLVGQSIVVNPTIQNPKHGMVDMILPGKVEELTIIQGVLVDPDYRGNRLMTEMVDAWLEIAEKEGRNHALAEVAVDNYYSWSVFLKEGMEIHSLGLDQSDGTNLYNIHANVQDLIAKRLTPDFNKAAAKNIEACPVNDLSQQKKLIADGYTAVAYDVKAEQLHFKKQKPPQP